MEAFSVEDMGEGICFHVYAYNVQPGVLIDYATGNNEAVPAQTDASMSGTTPAGIAQTEAARVIASQKDMAEKSDYVLNTNTLKFHRPTCNSVSEMQENNKKEVYGTREEIIAQGYEPCGRCRP